MPQVQGAPGGGFTVTSSTGRGTADGLARATALLDAFAAQKRDREQKEKERAFKMAELAMESVGKNGVDPSSTAVRRAIDGVRKYDPDAAALLDASLQQATTAHKAKLSGEEAGQRWMQGVEAREQPLREIVQNPGAWQAPLLTPDMASARIPQVPQEVASSMPFQDREAARVWAKGRGYTFPAAPTPIDPYGSTFPADTRAHLAAAAGLLPPEVAEGERIGRGLKPSVGQVMQSEQQAESGERARERLELDRQAQRLAERRLQLDQQKEARIAAGGTEDGAPAAKTSDVAAWMADETKLRADERAARLGLVKMEDRADAAAEIPEAPPMSRLQATRIVSSIVTDLKANGLPTDDAVVQEAAGRAVEMYSELTSPSPQLAPGKMAQHSDGTRVLVLGVEGDQAIVERNGKRFRIAANTLKPVPATREEAVRVLLGR